MKINYKLILLKKSFNINTKKSAVSAVYKYFQYIFSWLDKQLLPV